MKRRFSAVAGIIAVLFLFAAFDFAAENGIAKSAQMNEQAAMKNNPQTVMQIQQALSEKGYYQGSANGRWDSSTQNAIKKYQKAEGLNANGQLDPQTLSSLGIESSGSAAGGQQDMSSSSQSGAGGQQDTMPQQQSGPSSQPGGSGY